VFGKRSRLVAGLLEYRHPGDPQFDESRANALLIAAAPVLLAALELACKYLAKAVAEDLMPDCVRSPRCALDKALAAIAQATGCEIPPDDDQDESYHVEKDEDDAGTRIVDRHGAILYDGLSLEGLSDEVVQRLAELHSQNPELDWEGAEVLLRHEGLVVEVSEDQP